VKDGEKTSSILLRSSNNAAKRFKGNTWHKTTQLLLTNAYTAQSVKGEAKAASNSVQDWEAQTTTRLDFSSVPPEAAQCERVKSCVQISLPLVP